MTSHLGFPGTLRDVGLGAPAANDGDGQALRATAAYRP